MNAEEFRDKFAQKEYQYLDWNDLCEDLWSKPAMTIAEDRVMNAYAKYVLQSQPKQLSYEGRPIIQKVEQHMANAKRSHRYAVEIEDKNYWAGVFDGCNYVKLMLDNRDQSQPKQLSDEEIRQQIDGIGWREHNSFRDMPNGEYMEVSDVMLLAKWIRVRTGGGVDLRPPLARFAAIMEEQLKSNDHKAGWEGDGLFELFARLSQESDELHHEIFYSKDPSTIEKEAADVANFAMMIADNARRLTQRNQQEKG